MITDLVGRVIRYPCDERGIYVRDHLPLVNCHVSHVNVTSIEGYTQCKIERDGRARKLYHDLSAEKIRNLEVWLRSNQAKNVPVSVKDVNLAEKCFKTGIATCKGKSKRPSPPVVATNDFIELPTELFTAWRKIELAIDVF